MFNNFNTLNHEQEYFKTEVRMTTKHKENINNINLLKIIY